MERLTKLINGVIVYVGTDNPYPTGQIPCEVSPQGVREIMGHLAAYENTELTPEEVSALVKDWSDLCTIIGECGGLTRVRALAEADKAGRLVVLPCKVGDTVYVINRHLGQIFANTVISISVGNSTDLKNYIRTKWVGEKGNESIRKWTLRQVGRYVFLTRKEAEAALEAMKDE